MSGMVVAVREWGRWLSYWAPALVWMGIIFFLSGRTADELGGWFPFLPDLNWGHLVGYLVLAVLVRFALKRTVATPRPGGWAVLIGVLYGISDEFHQYFVPSRSPNVKDLAVDAVGALLGVLLVSRLEKSNGRAVLKPERRR